MLNQSLKQKQLQKLSPQQIQLMKLLQIPTATLDQRIQEELEANPALEESDHADEKKEEDLYEKVGEEDKEKEEKEDDFDDSIEDYMEDYFSDDTASYKLHVNNHSPDEEDKSIPVAMERSFQEHLDQQLGLLNLSEHEEIVAKQIVGSIDDDGYLRREPISIVDDLAFGQNISTDENTVQKMLLKIQRFEPAGIGARNLQECLALQLQRKIQAQDIDTNYTEEEKKSLELAHKMILNHFDEFSKKHYNKLLKQLHVDRDTLRDAIDEVLKLNPKPGSGYAPSSKFRRHYIVPDFFIENKMGELELRLNSRNAPELRVNTHYRDTLKAYSVNKKDKKTREAAVFIKSKIDSAKWFIDAIQQRQNTMLRTMHTIMDYQKDFFLSGDQKRLRPMILKDIAEITGLDISTVSRVANSKYVQTEFGTMRLKDFFSESLQTTSGEEVSTLEVKEILTEFIQAEDKRKPLSDEKLKDALCKRGYNIARRTVAKYREQLGIPVARLRKEL